MVVVLIVATGLFSSACTDLWKRPEVQLFVGLHMRLAAGAVPAVRQPQLLWLQESLHKPIPVQARQIVQAFSSSTGTAPPQRQQILRQLPCHDDLNPKYIVGPCTAQLLREPLAQSDMPASGNNATGAAVPQVTG